MTFIKSSRKNLWQKGYITQCHPEFFLQGNLSNDRSLQICIIDIGQFAMLVR